MTRIGFVGLGNMGAPMCHRLIQAGHQVHVFDADPDKTAAASLAGGYPPSPQPTARAPGNCSSPPCLVRTTSGPSWLMLARSLP
jgi:hypothetical protein